MWSKVASYGKVHGTSFWLKVLSHGSDKFYLIKNKYASFLIFLIFNYKLKKSMKNIYVNKYKKQSINVSIKLF
jgi:hypothetical protein